MEKGVVIGAMESADVMANEARLVRKSGGTCRCGFGRELPSC